MNLKKAIFPIFILMVSVQLYVPSSMIWHNEDILETGKEFKFKTAPIDPNDPFRGKYIILDYDNNVVKVSKEHDWKRGEDIYVSFTENKDGFVVAKTISREKPSTDTHFVKAEVGFINYTNNDLSFDYPFDRFYMEESKAHDAEITYWESQRDTTKTAYALVHIKNGDAVLKDVLIDGVPIRELVDTEKENNQ